MLLERIQGDLNSALKTKNELKVSTLRLLIGAVKNFAIAKESANYTSSDEEVLGVIQKEIKQRKESIEQFNAGGRQDLVDKETEEMEILQQYLPEQLSNQAIEQLVDSAITETGASSVSDMGKVMAVLAPKLKGKSDLSTVSQIVREKLSNG